MSEVERRIEWAMPSPRKLFTPAVSIVLVLMVAGFALIYYAPDFTVKYLLLSWTGISHGRLWQLLTYSFINGCNMSFVFNAMLVLFVGSSIEREWRTRAFVLLWLIVSAVCGIVWVAVSAILGANFVGMGTEACGYGLIAVFGLLYRGKRFFALFWAVEAQYLALALVVIGIILGIRQPITWIWVSGALVAYLYVKLRWRIRSVKAAPPSRYKPGSFVDID
jgi:membrane associated rhomboid family serine protease